MTATYNPRAVRSSTPGLTASEVRIPPAAWLTAVLALMLSACGGGASGGASVVKPPSMEMLSVTLSGSGGVTSSPSGINCGNTCSSSFALGATVTLTAQAAAGFTFSGWSGACSGSGSGSCSVTLNSAQSVTATFTAMHVSYPLNVTNTAAEGAVKSSPGGISCGNTCSASFAAGSTVTLTAQAASGYAFSGWSGACSGSGTCVVTMSTAESVAASYTASGGSGPTAASASSPGPYTVQSYSSGIPVTANYVEPLIYYPANAPKPFPALVFVAGNCETYQSTANQPQYFTDWGTFLASHGFVVMFVNPSADGCNGGKSAALLDGLTTLIAENTRSGSPLTGSINTSQLSVMGHSFGGAGAFYSAAAAPAGLKAAIGLTPVESNGGYSGDNLPSLMIGGQTDPYNSDQAYLSQYQSISTSSATPKIFAEFLPQPANVSGGVWKSMHHIADSPLTTYAVGGITYDNPCVPVVARLGLSFLEVYVVGDMRYQQFLVSDPTMFLYDHNP